MSVSPDVNFEEIARSTDEFNGAQLKAVCVEAGMIALREGATRLAHEHFLSGIAEGVSFVYFLCRMLMLWVCSAKQEEEYLDVLCVVLFP
jgi:SpoVK/Ycf46/Vps4 family AAA+-type ATPase